MVSVAEKIFARHMLSSSAAADVGVEAVKPGDTGFTRVDLRFSHEYVTPMAAIFYEQNVGKDVPVNDASSIRFFRDHLTFLDEVISEEKKKIGLLDLATQLKFKQQDFAKQQGIKLHGELTDRKGSEGICHSVMLETYACPARSTSAPIRTRRTSARWDAWPSGSGPPMYSIPGSPKMFA